MLVNLTKSGWGAECDDVATNRSSEVVALMALTEFWSLAITSSILKPQSKMAKEK